MRDVVPGQVYFPFNSWERKEKKKKKLFVLINEIVATMAALLQMLGRALVRIRRSACVI